MKLQTLINGHPFKTYKKKIFKEDEMLKRSAGFFLWMNKRRSVRSFSDRTVSKEVIENILKAASAAPSGAHKQPWTFCVVFDKTLKKEIRIAAEKEEFESYENRMNEEWINDLAPLQTDWHKDFLETAPCLIIVFKRSYKIEANGKKHQNYYATESCGIACGFLLTAIHFAGLAALTHTPSPMNFLSVLLKRPQNEKPFLLIPVGYVAEECLVPDIQRKPLEEISIFYE